MTNSGTCKAYTDMHTGKGHTNTILIVSSILVYKYVFFSSHFTSPPLYYSSKFSYLYIFTPCPPSYRKDSRLLPASLSKSSCISFHLGRIPDCIGHFQVQIFKVEILIFVLNGTSHKTLHVKQFLLTATNSYFILICIHPPSSWGLLSSFPCLTLSLQH